MASCDSCGTIHGAFDTRAQRRFSPDGKAGFRAALPGAPLRATRDEAIQDVCDARQARQA